MIQPSQKPWRVVSVPGEWDGIAGRDGELICQIAANNPANIALIVEAPELKDRIGALEEANRELLDTLKNLLSDVEELPADSEGVAGLHLNGDIAPWVDLLPGGHYEAWLEGVDAARTAIAKAESDALSNCKAIDRVIALHATLLEENPYCYFELAYTRQTEWMAWLCSNAREHDPNRVVITKGQGGTPEEACQSALDGYVPCVKGSKA